MGACRPQRARRVWSRRQRGDRRVPGPTIHTDPADELRKGTAVAEPGFARRQRSDRTVAPLLGSRWGVVRGQPLLGSLSVEWGRQHVGAGPADRALHLESGRAEPLFYP